MLHSDFIKDSLEKLQQNYPKFCYQNFSYPRCYSLTLVKITNTAMISSTHFNISLNAKNKFLRSVYKLSKLHKNLAEGRFIIAVLKCSLKPLSKCICSVFKVMLNKLSAITS